jgi:Family of unknown function (DUF5990)
VERDLTLRIVLEKPTPGVDFGVQKGRGGDYETIQKQRSDGKDLCFEFSVRVKTVDGDTAPNFLGPMVQGPSGARFVYIDIGTYAGQKGTRWSRRLKIPLTGITRKMVDGVVGLETYVRGTGKDGGPGCGTAKPFAGWKPVLSNRR